MIIKLKRPRRNSLMWILQWSQQQGKQQKGLYSPLESRELGIQQHRDETMTMTLLFMSYFCSAAVSLFHALAEEEKISAFQASIHALWDSKWLSVSDENNSWLLCSNEHHIFSPWEKSRIAMCRSMIFCYYCLGTAAGFWSGRCALVASFRFEIEMFFEMGNTNQNHLPQKGSVALRG